MVYFHFLGLKIRSPVFFTLRLRLFALNQFVRLDKSLFTCFDNISSNGLDRIMLVSSAKWYVFQNLILLCRSLIYMRKRSGPRSDPCGTPVIITLTEDILLTNCFLFLR